MRILCASLLVSLLASAAFAEEPRASQALCDATKIGARELAECLRKEAEKSDKELSAAIDGAIKTLEARPKLLSSQKSRWKHSLTEAQTQWISWRDSECQDVAPFEAGMAAKGGDPRLACIIDQNARRIADIKSRYP